MSNDLFKRRVKERNEWSKEVNVGIQIHQGYWDSGKKIERLGMKNSINQI
jgi:hypothetical protein